MIKSPLNRIFSKKKLLCLMVGVHCPIQRKIGLLMIHKIMIMILKEMKIAAASALLALKEMLQMIQIVL